jgi:hypothetical protein
MADDKKPADKKPAAPAEKGPLEPDLAKLRMFFWVLIVLAVILTGLTLRLGVDENGKLNFPPKGEFIEGNNVANVTDVSVRSAPGGSIIGKQDKREIGELEDGPFKFGGKTWWRVSYEIAPSGWVTEDDLTAYVGLYILLNIIPYSFDYVMPVAIVVFLISGIGLMVVRHKLEQVPKVGQKEEEEWMRRTNKVISRTKEVPPSGIDAVAEPQFRADPRWQHILAMTESVNPSEWRQAIIEADIILEEILSKIGYEGLTIGDKLKNVEPSDMSSLDDAWTAHKVRNRIAHDGMNYKLSHADVKDAINRYRKVFEEFNIV